MRQVGASGKGIEQFALRILMQQRLVRMLTVDRHKKFPRSAHLLQGYGMAVDIVARAAIGFQDTAHQTAFRVALQVVFIQPARQFQRVL